MNKSVKTILVAGVTGVVILIVALLMISPSKAASGSPFLGAWYGTDTDGSDIRLSISGSPNGPFHITSTDSYISFCSGDAGIIRGTGSLNIEISNLLEAHVKVICFTSGNVMEFDTSFSYNAQADTLFGMSVTWYRANEARPGCMPPPQGLSGWWPGDGNTEDIVAHRTAVLMGNATTGPGLVDKAFLLHGNGDYIEVPDDPALNFGTGDFTVDLWVNFGDLMGEQVLMEKWIQADGQEHLISQGWTLTKLNNQALLLAMSDGIGGEWGVSSSELNIQPNTWYLFSATRQGVTITLYMDGEVIAAAEIEPINLDAPTSLKFGRREGGQGFYLNGRIDELEVYNGTALSEEQVLEMYSVGRLGKCKSYINSPAIRAHPEWDNVDAWWWPEDKIITLTIDDPNTLKNPDIKMKQSGADLFAGTVWFELTGYDLKPGDIVSMTDGDLTKTLTISTLTITDVNLASGKVYGTAQPGVIVRVPTPAEIYTTADACGNWEVDFGSAGYVLQPGSMMIAEEFDSDGDLTSFEYLIP